MSTQARKYKVTIFGESYTLVSDEPEQHVVESARNVDSLMSAISRDSGIVDVKKLAVLVSLQLASELRHLKTGNEALKNERNRLDSLLGQGLDDLV